jgi:hypothetical protein
VEKILFDNPSQHNHSHNDNECIEMENINNNDNSYGYKVPEVKMVNINNNFNISLESIMEQSDTLIKERKASRSKTTKELKPPIPFSFKARRESESKKFSNVTHI